MKDVAGQIIILLLCLVGLFLVCPVLMIAITKYVPIYVDFLQKTI